MELELFVKVYHGEKEQEMEVSVGEREKTFDEIVAMAQARAMADFPNATRLTLNERRLDKTVRFLRVLPIDKMLSPRPGRVFADRS